MLLRAYENTMKLRIDPAMRGRIDRRELMPDVGAGAREQYSTTLSPSSEILTAHQSITLSV